MNLPTINDLSEAPIWVAWQTEPRGDKQTKVPYSPRGGLAKSNDASTWGTRDEAQETYEQLSNPGGVGVVLAPLVDGTHLGGVDLDACIEGGALLPWAQEIVDKFDSYTEVSPSGIGLKVFFLYDEQKIDGMRGKTARRRSDGPKDYGIEFYLSDRYFTVTGEQATESAELRLVDREVLDWLIHVALPTFRGKKEKKKPTTLPLTIDDVAEAFAIIPNQNLSWEEWNTKGMAIYAMTKGEGFDIFDTWSKKASVYSLDSVEERWENYKTSPPDQLNAGSIIFWTRQTDPEWIPPSVIRANQLPVTADEAITLAFAERHADELRYTAEFSYWHHWNGTYWQKDRTLLTFSLSRQICRDVADAIKKKKEAVASARTVAAVVNLARADRRLAATVKQWDRDPWLLATPGGTVDLRSGEMSDSSPTDYITKTTAAAPIGDCPLFRETLLNICGGSGERMDYLQRIAGYCLTGLTREEKIFFFTGSGGNGKGTFVETLAWVLGEHSTTVAMSTLVMTKHQEHPTEIAKLKGVRLAVASETMDGARWNVARIKLLTGGDQLTGRFMRGDFFDFDPTHKLIVSSNRKPMLGAVDNAIARRMELVPFDVEFKSPDTTLKERLRAEGGGILKWLIEGCMLWQKVGIGTPADVAAATAEYLAEQDDIQIFLHDRCSVDPKERIAVAELYVLFQEWCERNGAYLCSKKEFTQRLAARGIRTDRSHGVTFAYGLRLGESLAEGGYAWAGADGARDYDS